MNIDFERLCPRIRVRQLYINRKLLIKPRGVKQQRLRLRIRKNKNICLFIKVEYVQM